MYGELGKDKNSMDKIMEDLRDKPGKPNRKQLLEKLKKIIQSDYGKKCPDYDPFCAVCIMWRALETVKEGIQ